MNWSMYYKWNLTTTCLLDFLSSTFYTRWRRPFNQIFFPNHLPSFRILHSWFKSLPFLSLCHLLRGRFVLSLLARSLCRLMVLLETKERNDGDLNCRPLEWQASVLTARPCHSPGTSRTKTYTINGMRIVYLYLASYNSTLQLRLS